MIKDKKYSWKTDTHTHQWAGREWMGGKAGTWWVGTWRVGGQTVPRLHNHDGVTTHRSEIKHVLIPRTYTESADFLSQLYWIWFGRSFVNKFVCEGQKHDGWQGLLDCLVVGMRFWPILAFNPCCEYGHWVQSFSVHTSRTQSQVKFSRVAINMSYSVIVNAVWGAESGLGT